MSSTLEELVASVPEKYAKYVELRGFQDQSVFVCKWTILDSNAPDDEWKLVLGFADEFLRLADRTERLFHFIFDLSRCEQVPLQRMHDLQNCLYQDGKKEILKRRLISSVIIFKNRMVKMILDMAWEVYPPVRPCCAVSYESDEQMARDTLQFIRDSRAEQGL